MAIPKIETTPVVATLSAATEAPAATPIKKGFFSSILSPTATSVSLTREQKHQPYLNKMMPKLRDTSDTLYGEVYNTIKKEDFTKLLGYHRDLNLVRADQAMQSETFTKFKGLLNKSMIQNLMVKGTSNFASPEGGVSHAEERINLGLLEAMRGAVNEALKGVSTSDADKQGYSVKAVESIAETLKAAIAQDVAAGQGVSPATIEVAKQAEFMIQGLESNVILADQMKTGGAAKKTAQVKGEIQKQKTAFQKQEVQAAAKKLAEETQAAAKKLAEEIEATKKSSIDGIQGVYQVADARFAKLEELQGQLEALSNSDDATVGKASKNIAEATKIAEQIVSLIKEINPTSTISIEDIKNPNSRTLVSDTEETIAEPINKNFENEKNNVKLIVLKKVVEANKDFIQQLNDIHARKGFLSRQIERAMPSQEKKVIELNATTIKEIQSLDKAVTAFAAAKALAEANKDMTWTKRFGQMKASVTSYMPNISNLLVRAPKLSDLEKAKAAFDGASNALDNFLLEEGVVAILEKEANLLVALHKADKQWFGKAAAKQKIQGELEGLRSNQADVLSKYSALLTAKDDSFEALEIAQSKESEVAQAAIKAAEAREVEAKENDELDLGLYIV